MSSTNQSKRRRWLAPALAAGIGAAAAIATQVLPRVIGPDNRIQPSGRRLNPVGKLTELGNLPAGGALTVDGRFAWTLSAGRGRNDIRIVRVRSRKPNRVGEVVQKIVMPGVSGGIAMAPDGLTAYVSGTPEGGKSSNSVPDEVPGQDGDVIHVFTVNPKSGHAERDGVIEVPPPRGTLPPQNFPPTNTAKAPNAKLSARLPLETPDQVPQRLLDKILWQYAHGEDSQPPPPGPNASGLDEREWRKHKVSDAEALDEVIEMLDLDEEAVRDRYDADG